jgi:hypothetical protein
MKSVKGVLMGGQRKMEEECCLLRCGAVWRHIQEDGILDSQCQENLKSYKNRGSFISEFTHCSGIRASATAWQIKLLPEAAYFTMLFFFVLSAQLKIISAILSVISEP